jgi:hypothetical protein
VCERETGVHQGALGPKEEAVRGRPVHRAGGHNLQPPVSQVG